VSAPLAERMFAAGFTDLVPVIPPGAALAPTSRVAPSSIGKIPGRRLENGLWVSGAWREWTCDLADVREWARWGANVGLRADRFPGVDIDCKDEQLAQVIEDVAKAELGNAPVRVGNPPKRLLMYRTDEPFTRMRLYLSKGDAKHLVEILGVGQQYIIDGTHPTTLRSYGWDCDPAHPAMRLPTITKAQAGAFLAKVQEVVEGLGWLCTRREGGDAVRRSDQSSLEAPSIDELRTVVSLIPNSEAMFPGWDEFVKMLHAVRAAAGPDEEDGFDIFMEWAARWELHGARHTDSNDPDAYRALWRRTHGPYAVGWSWLAEQARPYGYNDADFPTEGEAPARNDELPSAPFLSDQWLASKVVESAMGVLRYSPSQDIWYVWNKGRWQPDAEMLAEDTVKLELRRVADKIARMGADEKEKAKWLGEARGICSGGKVTTVARLVQSDRAIAISQELLDFDPWLLNTPGGIIDLKTGAMQPHDADQLCTRMTSVAPTAGEAPLWQRFLAEATGGDAELQGYLKRLAGYALTGSTREQQFSFIYGPGGNGKGVFINALTGILGSYYRDSPMDTFIASNSDRHPTELAALAGARLVTASETDADKRWDEAKLKRLTGGDPITARHMREDFFTYIPQFKLIFIGNYKPEIRNLDKAVRRRTHLVPFMVTPAQVDQELGAKLRQEYPAILAWMIEGCLEWQLTGLNPPASVREATDDYFDESDPFSQWLAECTEPAEGDEAWVPLLELFDSWKEWSNRRGGYIGKIQRLGSLLVARHYPKRKHPRKRHVEFGGITIIGKDPMETAK
jgi:P4 family phage/plasmid primase-like protien